MKLLGIEVKRLISTLLLLAVAACTGGPPRVSPIPQDLRQPQLKYFVQNHGKDDRGIDQVIAHGIRSRGLKAESGLASIRPADLDVLVVYEEQWKQASQDDLEFLRIDLRDPETHVLLATGHSYRTRWGTVSMQETVGLILEGLFGGP